MAALVHRPVLLRETIAALAPRAGGRYVDGTLGRAGHASAILDAGGEVLGIDRDDQALEEVAELASRDARFARLKAVRGVHGDLAAIAAANGWEAVDGVLLDLGVSSPQLDEARRGFSFLREGPLDMRMDRSRALTAADLVNSGDEDRLEEIFRTLGEEPRARQLARAIARAVAGGRRFQTTTSLADFIAGVVPRHGAHHPATRVFQALRMAVNDELGELERALAGALSILSAGGRIAVITFESLSDRIVKRFFADHVGREVALQQGGSRWEGALPRVSLVTRKPVVAGDDEIVANPRSRSAKLRAAMRNEE